MIKKKTVVFIANNNLGEGLSGGDRIFAELMKRWSEKVHIIFLACEEAVKIAKRHGVVGIKIVQTDKCNQAKIFFTVEVMIRHVLGRIYKGIIAVNNCWSELRKADFIYSVSDFYPDVLPVIWAKLRGLKAKWIAGFYLFAPNPFLTKFPYQGKHWMRGAFYWITQYFSYWVVKRFADVVFVTSEPDVEKFVTKKRGRNKIVVIRGGVDIKSSEKYLNSEDKIPVEKRKYDACFVGRFHPQKGVLELIDIWKLVCKRKSVAKLAIIGMGSLEDAIREKIKRLHLGNNIELLGFKDGEKKYEIFKQSKIILHPATYDSGGMAACEAMAWELPGVSFDLEALKTYYPKGMIKVSCYDIQVFANNIIQLLEDDKLYKKISNEALDWTREWDWDKRAKDVYDSLKVVYG